MVLRRPSRPLQRKGWLLAKFGELALSASTVTVRVLALSDSFRGVWMLFGLAHVGCGRRTLTKEMYLDGIDHVLAHSRWKLPYIHRRAGSVPAPCWWLSPSPIHPLFITCALGGRAREIRAVSREGVA